MMPAIDWSAAVGDAGNRLALLCGGYLVFKVARIAASNSATQYGLYWKNIGLAVLIIGGIGLYVAQPSHPSCTAPDPLVGGCNGDIDVVTNHQTAAEEAGGTLYVLGLMVGGTVYGFVEGFRAYRDAQVVTRYRAAYKDDPEPA